MSTLSVNTLTTLFVDLATYDELELRMYAGGSAISYFNRRNIKSTWFSILPVPQSATTSPGSGTFASGASGATPNLEWNLTRSGDYLINSWFRIQLGSVQAAITTNGATSTTLGRYSIRWTRNLGHYMFNECSITFNDLLAVRLDSYFLDYWNAFTLPAGKQQGYQNMIGNVTELTNPLAWIQAFAGSTGFAGSGSFLPGYVLNVPLPFGFFRDTGVGLPTAALPYNEMRIKTSSNPWTSLLIVDNWGDQLTTSTTPIGTSRAATIADFPSGTFTNPALGATVSSIQPTIVQWQLYSTYAVVSNDERKRMGKAPRDILIEQVQTNSPNQVQVQTQSGSLPAFPAAIPAIGSNLNFRLNFSNAVKLIFFGVENYTNSNEHGNYTTVSPLITQNGAIFTPMGLGGPTSSNPITNNLFADPIVSVILSYEGSNRSQMPIDYYSLIAPFYHAPSIPNETGYHLYPYAIDIYSIDPIGSTNYGKLTNVSMTWSFAPEVNWAATGGTFVAGAAGTYINGIAGNGVNINTGAYLPQLFRTFCQAVNHNFVRVAGGALGFPLV